MKEMEREECTFQPDLYNKSKRYDNVESHYKKGNKLMINKISEKEKVRLNQIEQTKRDAEYEKMKGCTFKPSINEEIVDMAAPVEVHGIYKKYVYFLGYQKHLERQELQKKIEYDKKEREKKVFGYGENYYIRGHNDGAPVYTVPQPFHLSSVYLYIYIYIYIGLSKSGKETKITPRTFKICYG